MLRERTEKRDRNKTQKELEFLIRIFGLFLSFIFSPLYTPARGCDRLSIPYFGATKTEGEAASRRGGTGGRWAGKNKNLRVRAVRCI